jgi:hypothetical protein
VSDVAVCVPKAFGWGRWLAEGDAAGSSWTGREYFFFLAGPIPKIAPGERVYIFFNGVLRGYSPLERIERTERGYALVRRGAATAVTIPAETRGYRGFRYRWWSRGIEIPFPSWRDVKVDAEGPR